MTDKTEGKMPEHELRELAWLTPNGCLIITAGLDPNVVHFVTIGDAVYKKVPKCLLWLTKREATHG